MSTQNETLLNDIFLALFGLEDISDIKSISQDNAKSWDSVTHVALITALENEFDVFIDTADALSLLSYQKILDYIDKN